MARNDNSTVIGTNLPRDVDTSPITEALARDYAAAEDRTRELLDQARALPTTVTSEGEVERFSIIVRLMRDHDQTVEAYRKAEKEPYLRGGQAVDGWFNNIAERLGKAMKLLHARVNDFQQAKLERLRLEREAEQRKAREEAQKAQEAARRARSEESKRALELEAKLAAQRAAMAEARSEETPADMARSRFQSGAMTTMARDPQVSVHDWDAIPLELLRPYLRRDDILKAVKQWAKATSYMEAMPGVLIERDVTKTVIR